MAQSADDFERVIKKFASLRGGPVMNYQGGYTGPTGSNYQVGDVVQDIGNLYLSVTGDCTGPNMNSPTGPGWICFGPGVICVNNTAFVDPVKGDDGAAQLERPGMPYQTIAAALTAVQGQGLADDNRWKIKLAPGTYTEDVLYTSYTTVEGCGPTSIIAGRIIVQNVGNHLIDTDVSTPDSMVSPFSVLVEGEAKLCVRDCTIRNVDQSTGTKRAVTRNDGELEFIDCKFELRANGASIDSIAIFEHNSSTGNTVIKGGSALIIQNADSGAQITSIVCNRAAAPTVISVQDLNSSIFLFGTGTDTAEIYPFYNQNTLGTSIGTNCVTGIFKLTGSLTNGKVVLAVGHNINNGFNRIQLDYCSWFLSSGAQFPNQPPPPIPNALVYSGSSSGTSTDVTLYYNKWDRRFTPPRTPAAVSGVVENGDYRYQQTDEDGGSINSGGLAVRPKQISSNYTLQNEDAVIYADATNGPIVITLEQLGLPTVPFANPGRIFVIRKEDSSVNTVTLQAIAGETFEGVVAGSFVLSSEREVVMIQRIEVVPQNPNIPTTGWRIISCCSAISPATQTLPLNLLRANRAAFDFQARGLIMTTEGTLGGANLAGGFNGGGTGNKAILGIDGLNLVPINEIDSLRVRIQGLARNPNASRQPAGNGNPFSFDNFFYINFFINTMGGPRILTGSYLPGANSVTGLGNPAGLPLDTTLKDITFLPTDAIWSIVSGGGPLDLGLPTSATVTFADQGNPGLPLSVSFTEYLTATLDATNALDGGMPKDAPAPGIVVALGDSGNMEYRRVRITEIELVLTGGSAGLSGIYKF